MNERPADDASVVRDEGALPKRQTDHEGRVAGAEEDLTGQPISPAPGGSVNRYTGSEAESYEDEVEAEHEGTTADEVEAEKSDDPGGEAARIYTG
jgi:hypothetical protein